MKKHLHRGHVHCEHFFQQQQKLRKKCAKADWMSGHVHFDTASAGLKEIGFQDIRFFSCVRQPDAQVMSHLNWLIAIRNKSSFFFKRHPKNLQDISNDISTIGLDSKQKIIHVLQKYQWLFLNTQWNTIFSPDTASIEKTIDERLSRFEYIGTETNIPDLVLAITGKNIYQPKVTNKSRYYFDTTLFLEEELQAFLTTYNDKDLFLYNSVKKRFKSHDPREDAPQ